MKYIISKEHICSACKKKAKKFITGRKRLIKIVKGTKKCSGCKEVKRISEFSPDKSQTFGYKSRCKICRNKDSHKTIKRNSKRTNLLKKK